MTRIIVYLPDLVAKKAHTAAKSDGKSVSRWIADQVVENLADTWSKGVLAAAGAIPDFPTLGELRKGYGPDAREPGA